MSDIDPLAPTAVAPDAAPPLLTETFDGDRVTEIRHAVAARAEAAGLSGARLDDFVLAVNELMTNAVRHGGGQGWLRLWRTGEILYCLVSDTGAGIGADRLDDRRRPLPEIAGGWGLWLARQLSDEMVVDSGPAGTTVRISAHLDDTGTERPTG
ncbi:ATP-binding protein [Plantactinospora veratri]|uniref:ATP-binding protein n=1 Tax=Plantactinospora veratri TaxID=1436122 RepID=A0ABU7SHQ7_9ACTN